jgi:hypothetical protein
MNKDTSIQFHHSVIYNPKFGTKPKGLDIVRIHITNVFTKIDMLLSDERATLQNGKIYLHKEIFLQDTQTEEKYPFLCAENIAVFPDFQKYNHEQECIPITLYFKNVPDTVRYVNIIELDLDTQEAFNYNFYMVSLEEEQDIQQKIYNN